MRTLVVDDEDDVRAFCSRVLGRLGHQVTAVGSAEVALGQLREEAFDLLVTDVAMPGMTGLELITAARRVRPNLPAVVITGYGTIEVAIDAVRAGANEFVTKPFGVLDLQHACESALAQARVVAEHARLKALFPLFQLARYGSAAVASAAPDAGGQRPADGFRLAEMIVETALHECRADGAALFASAKPGQAALVLAHGGLLPEPMPDMVQFEAMPAAEDTAIGCTVEDCPAELNAALREAGISLLIRAPLDTPHRRVGLLVVMRSEGREAFGRGDLELLTVLGSQGAAALDNLRMLRELEAWNRELEDRVAARTAELERARDELLRAQRLAVIGELGASVAHEMRNPLGVINNSVYYLRQRLAGADPAVDKHLDIIHREVEASNRIITELMSLVRTASVQTQAVSAADLLARSLQRAAVPETIRVSLEGVTAAPLLQVDPEKMELAFVNLISNAVQAMPDGGDLRVAFLRHAEPATGADWLEFAFEDTGVGIAAENLERVFEPLFTTKAKGIGLGLAIVRRMVEAHGGSVHAESRAGAGARFVVRLPIAGEADLQEAVSA